MDTITLIQCVLIGIGIYICVFAIVDRICKCCEQCATAKALGGAYGEFMKSQQKEKTNG